jgi:hypothetical protein
MPWGGGDCQRYKGGSTKSVGRGYLTCDFVLHSSLADYSSTLKMEAADT